MLGPRKQHLDGVYTLYSVLRAFKMFLLAGGKSKQQYILITGSLDDRNSVKNREKKAEMAMSEILKGDGVEIRAFSSVLETSNQRFRPIMLLDHGKFESEEGGRHLHHEDESRGRQSRGASKV
jgi:hypothetical protein